jgi:SAM-dependent methyltransferase
MRDFNNLDLFIQRKRTQKIAQYVPKGSTVLDLGCGYYPYTLDILKNKINSGIGIDREPSETYQAQNVYLIKGNIEDQLPLPTESFDCILMLAVLEHLRQPEKTLAECFRLLKQEGLLIITIPTNYSKPVLELLATFNLISREEIFDHQHYYSINQGQVLLKKSGFTKKVGKFYNLFLNALFVYKK